MLSLIARRLAQTASRRGIPTLRLVSKVALSTDSKKKVVDMSDFVGASDHAELWVSNPAVDTHMAEEFRILEQQLEEGLKSMDNFMKLPFAIDAPDGESDGHLKGELAEAKAIFDDMAAHKEEIRERLAAIKELVEDAKKIYAVDSPDGDSDAHMADEMAEVDNIINFAAEHEDKKKIEKEHKLQQDVRKFHAKDPEHDW